MTYIITFVCGLMVGACIGVIVMGLIIAGKESDNEQTPTQ